MPATRAIVIGASLAGLCAAKAVCEHFDEVVVIERDVFGELDGSRSFVPQGHHPHLLLTRGQRALDSLFTGFSAQMLRRGALYLDESSEIATRGPLGWFRRIDTGIRQLFATRALLDSVLRSLWKGLPNASIADQTSVLGLLPGPGHSVGGALLHDRARGSRREMRADLVIDASGKEGRSPEWLQALGVSPPDETVLDIHLGYSTRCYRLKDGAWPSQWWWRGARVEPPLDGIREAKEPACVLFPVENSHWLVNLTGWSGQYPPDDDATFTKTIEHLSSPIVAEFLQRAEPVSRVRSFRLQQARLRHFERWRRPLPGFVALGDSVCALDPAQGQGMSVAATEAVLLRSCVREFGGTNARMAPAFFQRQARFLRTPWLVATGLNSLLPGAKGNTGGLTKLAGLLYALLWFAAHDDSAARQWIAEVSNLIRPLATAADPSLMLQMSKMLVRLRLERSARVHPLMPQAS